MDFLGVVMLFMSGVLRYGTLILLGVAVAGCNDISQTRTDTDAKPRVRAAQWVRNTTDIEWYRIERGEENAVDLALLDSDLDPLARMSVRPAPASNPFDSDKAIQGVLTLDSDPDKQLTLITQDVRLGDGYMTRMELENQNGDTMRMRTQHRRQSCLDPEPKAGFTEQSGPSCASPVPANKPPYAVPSCGQPSFLKRSNLEEYQLTSMKYLKLDPPRKPAVGGNRFNNSGDVTGSWVTVYKDNRDTPLAEENDIAAWLTDTGTGAIVGTEAQMLLTGAFQDRAWRRYVEDKLLKDKISSSPGKANLFVGCSVSAYQQAGGPPRAAECSRSPALDTMSSIADIITFDPTDPGDVIGAIAGLWGDPHMTGALFYDFMATGDYVLLKSDDGSVEVQARLEPLDSSPPDTGPACNFVSISSAVALRFDDGTKDTTVRVFNDRFEQPEVDGAAVTSIADVASALPDNVGLEVERDSYVFVLDDGTRLLIGDSGSEAMAVKLLKAGNGTRDYSGLLEVSLQGDQFVDADGNELGDAPTQDDLYNKFGESYRVDVGVDSLFDTPGSTYGTASSPGYYPAEPARLSGLKDLARDDAEAACADVTDQPRRNACVLDAACMANPPRVPAIPQPDKHLSQDQRPFVISGAAHAGQPQNIDEEERVEESCRPSASRGNSVFVEAENVTLASPVVVDITKEDVDYGPENAAPSETLPSGEKVDVFLVHIPPRDKNRLAQLQMNLSFAGEILGVIVAADKLDDTDDLRDLNSSPYPEKGKSQRGFELDEGDGLTLSADRHQLEIRMAAGAIDLDQVRIFVAAQ